ncbi:MULTISPECIES: diiron oxygenase [unclassified Micromonospora]|uniref:diiron oxygenase n=1 Tax=unclassified Micromonospora TaxID=2617518 RepID=UPI00188F316A|nr:MULTISPECIES: diiron oxygenase [unclassified Micromonospora]MBF5028526.1 diiron oxygenase [Micromonospora sp. ANENR4]MCZ7473001.1 diiron oxygenase [Micromonospora sp. WMMC273]WBC03682.1 diiron oxygenase [Micromonospora sp. WMMA1976]
MAEAVSYGGVASMEARIAEIAAAVRDEPVYRSPFNSWDAKASVRNGPRRLLGEDVDGSLFFPPELVPSASHPLVTARGPEVASALLVQRLYQYLHFTTELESVAVIPVTSMIARNRSGLVLPDRMKADAFAITTDEAWHAQFSDDLTHQIERALELPSIVPADPYFVTRLDEIRHELGAQAAGYVDLAFSIVSETLISTILADLPRDTRLPRAVRDLVQDHALDEGRHHAYFRKLLTYFWGALDRRDRQLIGPWFPELIRTFLAPDNGAGLRMLVGVGLTTAEATTVIMETHDAAETNRRIAAAAMSTVRYLTEVGALDDQRTRESFMEAGMLP